MCLHSAFPGLPRGFRGHAGPRGILSEPPGGLSCVRVMASQAVFAPLPRNGFFHDGIIASVASGIASRARRRFDRSGLAEHLDPPPPPARLRSRSPGKHTSSRRQPRLTHFRRSGIAVLLELFEGLVERSGAQRLLWRRRLFSPSPMRTQG